MINIRKVLIGILLVIFGAAVSAGTLYFIKNKRPSNLSAENQEPPEAVVGKTNVDFSKLPERFPTNIPMESGAKLTQNYNATTPTGQFQATRTFETKQTLVANQTLYTDFLKKDGWAIKGTTDNPTYKMVMGVKGKQALLIAINEYQVTKIKTVSISFSETK